MAITVIMSVYDHAARTFATPFFVAHVDVAKRALAHAVNDPTQEISRSPEQFTLFELGEFESNTGKFTLLEQALSHGLASQFVRGAVTRAAIKNARRKNA